MDFFGRRVNQVAYQTHVITLREIHDDDVIGSNRGHRQMCGVVSTESYQAEARQVVEFAVTGRAQLVTARLNAEGVSDRDRSDRLQALPEQWDAPGVPPSA